MVSSAGLVVVWRQQRVRYYRAQAETAEALRESEERYRSLYENSTVGIYRTTPDGKILLANASLVNMLGYSSFDELSARDLSKDGYEPSYPRARFLELMEKEGEARGFESAWRRRDGNFLFVALFKLVGSALTHRLEKEPALDILRAENRPAPPVLRLP